MLILSVVPAFAVSEGDYSIRRWPKYEYKTVYGSDFDKTFSGYPSCQPEEGYSFPVDGGSAYFADNGGPTVTLTASIGGAYGNVSISTNIGKMATAGFEVNIPKSKNFYKVKVHKKVRFRPYVTYRRAKGSSEDWKVYNKGAVARKTINIIGEAELVK